MSGLSNIEISKYFNNYPEYRGCYCTDELKNISPLKDGECIVFNMQNTTDTFVGHWICSYFQDKIAYYFDSFGVLPPIEIEDYLSRSDDIKEIIYNPYKIQDIRSNKCGVYVQYVLTQFLKGKSFEYIIRTLVTIPDGYDADKYLNLLFNNNK